MDQDNTYTIDEVRNMIKRIQVLYSFLSPPSKRKFKKACNGNAMKKLINKEDLHEYIDPSFPNSKCVLFILPDERKETVTLNSFPSFLKNSAFLFKKDLNLN